MIPLGGAAIMGGASLLGNLFSGVFGASAQSQANQANRDIAYENRMWQENLANTGYQRAATDMKAAGLNPIAGVSPAGTPSGNTATMESANPMSGLGAGVQGGISTALSTLNSTADIEAKGSTVALQDAQKVTEGARAIQTANSARESDVRTQQMVSELPATKAKAAFEKDQADIDRDNITYDNIMKRAQQAVGLGSSAVDMVNPLKGLLKGKGASQGKSTFENMFEQWKKEKRTP